MLDTAASPQFIETWTLTPAQLEAVFEKSQRGDVIVYAVGDLGYSRQIRRSETWAQTEDTAALAYEMYRTGEADLTQKHCRDGTGQVIPHTYEYRIHKL
jgi:hypothetical protein